MTRQKGFSLIELLIVVAVILVITAIAIPNFLRSKMAANEASAASTLKTVGTSKCRLFFSLQRGLRWKLSTIGPPQRGVRNFGPGLRQSGGLSHSGNQSSRGKAH